MFQLVRMFPAISRLAGGIAVLLLATGVEAAYSAPTPSAASEYGVFFAEFMGIAPDSARVAPVEQLVLRRDVGTLELGPGTLVLCHPIAGRRSAAVFRGAGTFTYDPPDPIERQQLERFFGTAKLVRALEGVTLLFADSTLAELERTLAFAPGHAPAGAGATALEAVRYLSGRERKSRMVRAEIAKTILERADNGLFYAHLDPMDGPPLAFEIDPYSVESVQLWRRREDSQAGLFDWHAAEIVSQVRPGTAEQVAGLETSATSVARFETRDSSDWRPTIDISHYDLDVRLDSQMKFAATVTLAMRALEPQRWTWLYLDPEAVIDTVEWEGDARRASFTKGEDAEVLWVRFDPPLAAGESGRLSVRYHAEELVMRAGDQILAPTLRHWYPIHDPYGRATFGATYHVPSDAPFASAGARVSSESRDYVTTSHWKLDSRTRNFGFTIGYFKEAKLVHPETPDVNVMVERDAEAFAAEVARMVTFMQEAFGPAPIAALVAAKNPSTFGVSFPGLVLIGIDPIEKTASRRRELHRAHEVAHQWWGSSVDFASYHDQWLSEGFAQFAALWYLQVALRSNRDYLAALEDMRKSIVGNRRWILGSGQESGPVWLGRRTSTSVTPGDYGLIVYEKGAWVLHMLRTLLLDLDTMKEDRFKALMRDFYARFRGRNATTADFRDVAEQHAGQDLGWFFDPWVMGTGVPVYRFEWKAEPATGGGWQVRGRIEQHEVPASFRMPIVLRIEFGKDQFAWVRQWAAGPVTEFTLPPTEAKPTRVVFNDLQSVLCEMKK